MTANGPTTGNLAKFNAMGGLVDTGIPAAGPGAAVTGTGTLHKLPVWSGANSLTDSGYSDPGATGVTVTLSLAAGADEGSPGLLINGAGNFVGLAIAPLIAGSSFIEVDSFGTTPSVIEFDAARGTPAAPTAVQNGDVTADFDFNAYDGTAYRIAAQIIATAAENFSAGHMAAKLSLRTVDTVSEALADRLVIDGLGNLNVVNGSLIQTALFTAPVTGATVTMAANQRRQILNPAGALATLTVVLPSAPANEQVAAISTTQTITALTVSAPGGASVNAGVAIPFAFAAGGAISFTYQTSSTTWFVSG